MTKMTKKQKYQYYAYLNSPYYDLDDAYKSGASTAKWRAWRYCKDLCEQKNGWGLRVVSKNTYQFTAGFLFKEDDKLMYMHITSTRDEPYCVEEEEDV